MIQPSCPAIVIHDDDPFRRNLIKVLDEQHFMVTFTADGAEAVSLLETRKFRVVILGIDVAGKRGMQALEHLRSNRKHCGVIILGDAHPEIRTFAPWVDETLLKPVDPAYVAQRARTYCNC